MSDGYCEVDFGDASDDSEPVEFFDSRIVKARKAHQCSECGGLIAAGEAYQRTSYRFERAFRCDYRCDACREVAGEFEHNLVGGMLWESFAVEWDNGANVQGCLNRLASVRAKAVMLAQWQAKRAEQAAARRAGRQKI